MTSCSNGSVFGPKSQETPANLQLVLASRSPRRRRLLEGSGLVLLVRRVDVREAQRAGEGPVELALRLAAAKAEAGRLSLAAGEPDLVVGSDTVVVLDGRVLGKPRDADDAARMLGSLSGRTHVVVSAWAVTHRDGRRLAGHEVASVRFRALAEAEVATYVATGEPLDKAGAYGIQGRAGRFVESIDGGCDTVSGLPLAPVRDALAQLGLEAAGGTQIARRLATIRGRMAGAACGIGREPGEVGLVAVSKGQPPHKLEDALRAGQRVFGESYVKEWHQKVQALAAPPGIEWHFIGGLQRNKALSVAGGRAQDPPALVHGVDSERLAAALAKGALQAGRRLPVLLQVNLAGEQTKGGATPDELPKLLLATVAMGPLDVQGLMMLPPEEGWAAMRERFAQLRTLRDALATRAAPLQTLSMGMSADFEAAIAEGATLVRVGTAIFGPRVARA